MFRLAGLFYTCLYFVCLFVKKKQFLSNENSPDLFTIKNLYEIKTMPWKQINNKTVVRHEVKKNLKLSRYFRIVFRNLRASWIL